MSSQDIDTLLTKWFETKEEISALEKKLEKYKKAALKIMETNNTDKLSNNSFLLKKRDITKATLSKDGVPKDVWEKYSKKSTYSAFYLTEK